MSTWGIVEASRASLRRAAPADSGHSALVYLTKRGAYEVVKDRLTMAELWLATPREAYIVDTAPHVDTFQFQLPSEDQVFSFSVEVAVRWHIADPISAVRAQLKSPKEEIKQNVELSLRATSRNFAAERWAAAEERMNSENLHRSTALPSGVMSDSCQVRLELAGETKEHVADLRTKRITAYADALQADNLNVLAQRLAGHHDDVNEVIGLLMEQRKM